MNPLRELGAAHEEAVTLSCSSAAFIDCPDDERLAAAHIASGKNTVYVGGVNLMICFDV